MNAIKLMAIFISIVAVHLYVLDADAEHSNGTKILCWMQPGVLYGEGANQGNCIPAIARNVVNGESINVCSINANNLPTITKEAITVWENLLGIDLFNYQENGSMCKNGNTNKISSVIITKTPDRISTIGHGVPCRAAGWACVVHWNVTGDPFYTYTGQTEIRLKTSWVDNASYADKKKVVIHELGHVFGLKDLKVHLEINGVKQYHDPITKLRPEMVCQHDSRLPSPSDLSTMNGIPKCDNDTPTSADKRYYEEIYSPAEVTELTGTSSVAGRVDLNWKATNVHVEKDFGIRRCTARKTVCDAASASWTENVATAVTNAHVIRLTEQGSGWRTYRVVSRTSALTGDQAEAESTTVEVNVAAPSGGGGTTTSPSPTTTCTLAGSAGSGGSVGSANGACGTLAVTAEANAGYYVSSWTGCTNSPATGAGITTSTCSRAVAASDPNKTVSVTFALNQCTLNATAGTGGSVSPLTRTVNCGGSVTLTATPNQGYHVSGWTGGGCSGTGAKCTVTVGSSKGNATTVPVSVTFALNQCTLNARAGTGGSVSPTTRTVNCGQSVTLTVSQTSAQRTGYRFTGWSGGGCSSTTTTCTVTVGRAKGPVTTVNVRANFAVRSCQLRLLVGSGVGSFTTTSGGRTVHSGVRTVQCGQSISYSATAGTGYCFSRWGSASLGVSGQSSCRTTSGVQSIANFAADFTFTAHFTKKRYTLRITKTTGGSVSPGAGAYTYSHGTRVTITATPFYRFQTRWGGACSGSGRTCTVTMTGPRSVSVTFSPGGSGGFGEEEGGGPSGQAETPSATPSPSAAATATPSPSASATPAP